jgi:hypothetical protein
MVIAGGMPPTSATAGGLERSAAAVVPIPADCASLPAAELGQPHSSTFTAADQSDCFELPPLPADKSSLTVVQPYGGIAVTTVVDAAGKVLCTANALSALQACQLHGDGPFRLLAVPVMPV